MLRVVAFLVLAVIVSPRAHADVFDHARDDVTLSEEGGRLFEEGRAAAKKGNYPAACALFTRSLRIERAIGTQLNLADCLEHTDQLRAARDEFLAVEKLARESNQLERAQFAAQRIKALEGRLATLIVYVEDPTAPTLRILIDNRSVTVKAKIVELIDPGTIEVIGLTVVGRHSQTVELSGGQRSEVRIPKIVARPREDILVDGKFGRTELAFGSFLAGIHVGIRGNALLDTEGPGLAIGGSVGLMTAALILTDTTFEKERAQLYNSAQIWAIWNGGFLVEELDWGAQGKAALALGAHTVGFAGGLALWRLFRPSAGTIALTNSFFAWGTGLTYLAYNFIGDRGDALPTILAGDVALVMGAALSSVIDASRTRLFLIDLGGILGLAVGGFVLTAISDGERTTAGVGFLGGAVVGMGVTTLLTRGMERDAPPPAVMLMPTHNGIAVSGAF